MFIIICFYLSFKNIDVQEKYYRIFIKLKVCGIIFFRHASILYGIIITVVGTRFGNKLFCKFIFFFFSLQNLCNKYGNSVQFDESSPSSGATAARTGAVRATRTLAATTVILLAVMAFASGGWRWWPAATGPAAEAARRLATTIPCAVILPTSPSRTITIQVYNISRVGRFAGNPRDDPPSAPPSTTRWYQSRRRRP